MKRINKYLIITATLLILSVTAKTYAQSMNIVLTSGVSQSYSITSTSKIYFASSNLIFNNVSSSTPIDQIRKITFSTASGLFDTNSEITPLIVTPNPAQYFIRLNNLQNEKCSVNVYSATGSQVISTDITSSTEAIDITSLSKGIYIVRANNQTAKFVKL